MKYAVHLSATNAVPYFFLVCNLYLVGVQNSPLLCHFPELFKKPRLFYAHVSSVSLIVLFRYCL